MTNQANIVESNREITKQCIPRSNIKARFTSQSAHADGP